MPYIFLMAKETARQNTIYIEAKLCPNRSLSVHKFRTPMKNIALVGVFLMPNKSHGIAQTLRTSITRYKSFPHAVPSGDG
jgi:hypothetical protein